MNYEGKHLKFHQFKVKNNDDISNNLNNDDISKNFNYFLATFRIFLINFDKVIKRQFRTKSFIIIWFWMLINRKKTHF